MFFFMFARNAKLSCFHFCLLSALDYLVGAVETISLAYYISRCSAATNSFRFSWNTFLQIFACFSSAFWLKERPQPSGHSISLVSIGGSKSRGSEGVDVVNGVLFKVGIGRSTLFSITRGSSRWVDEDWFTVMLGAGAVCFGVSLVRMGTIGLLSSLTLIGSGSAIAVWKGADSFFYSFTAFFGRILVCSGCFEPCFALTLIAFWLLFAVPSTPAWCSCCSLSYCSLACLR